MYIRLLERLVERCMDQESPNYLEIIKRSRKSIASFNSEIIPQRGQTLQLPDGTAYDIVNVVLKVSQRPNQVDGVTDIVCEVVKNTGKKVFTFGSISTEDDWPIITAREFDKV